MKHRNFISVLVKPYFISFCLDVHFLKLKLMIKNLYDNMTIIGSIALEHGFENIWKISREIHCESFKGMWSKLKIA